METKPISSFYANAKLLLFGEYAVLDGSLALGIPLKLGQTLKIYNLGKKDSLRWIGFDCQDRPWIDFTLSLKDFSIDIIVFEENYNKSSNGAEFVSKLLKAARVLNPDFLTRSSPITINTHLHFPLFWGVGSSSTIIAMIAKWANVDWFSLMRSVSNGSGFDVACSMAKGPIFYFCNSNGATSKGVELNFSFLSQLFIVFPSKKTDSSKAIKKWNDIKDDREKITKKLDDIIKNILTTKKLDKFCKLIDKHENILYSVLKMPPAKNRFSDFDGSIKNLGAWDGDALLVATSRSFEYVKEYFKTHSIHHIFLMKDLMLTPDIKKRKEYAFWQ